MNEKEKLQPQPEPQSQPEPQPEPEEIHTAAEAELVEQVNQLRKEIATLREENKKLFLRLGGNDKPEKTSTDAIAEMLSAFRASGYDPSTLMKG